MQRDVMSNDNVFGKKLSHGEREIANNLKISYEDYYLAKIKLAKEGRQQGAYNIHNFIIKIKLKWWELKWNCKNQLRYIFKRIKNKIK